MNEIEYAEFGKGRFDSVSGSKMARIRRDAGDSILDVGCGPGAYLQALSRLGYSVAGVDENSIFLGRARAFSQDVFQVDLESSGLSQFRDSSFDTVLMLDILEHVSNPSILLQDARRVCRTNVILTVPAEMPSALADSQLMFASYTDPTHRRYYRYSGLADSLLQAGFTNCNVEVALHFDPIIYQILPKAMQLPFAFVNRVIKHFVDPLRFATVWYAVGWKEPTTH